MGKVSMLPIWKQGPTLTAAERLTELAQLAEAKPYLFEAFVLVRQSSPEDGARAYETHHFGCDDDRAKRYGILQLGLFEMNEERRR
jgi:hypothetical protein